MDTGGGPDMSVVPVACCCTGVAVTVATGGVSVATGGASLAAGVASTLSDDITTKWPLKQLQFHLPYNRSYW